MNKNALILIMALITFALAALLIEAEEKGQKARDKREQLKKDVERLNDINRGLQLKVDSITKRIEDRQKRIKILEQKGNEVAIIYRDKVTSVDSLTDDSVYSRLRSRYVRD